MPIQEERPKQHGLFSRHEEPAPAPVPVQEERSRKHGLFGRNRSPSPSPSSSTNGTRMTSSTYQTSPTRHSSDATGRRSLLHRSFGHGNHNDAMDPSIIQARERVFGAEAAERDADRALLAARESVRQAREEVRRLELEAEEEARRAKIKQYHAKEVSKRGQQLGRKLPIFPGSGVEKW